MKQQEAIELTGNYGATLSLIEVGLGSVLHGLHLPFAGVFLSLNQGYLLSRATLDARGLESRWIPYQISNVAAVLKSFSPAGKKLGPMLSISMQGLLFNIGTVLLGRNRAGLSLGMVLLSFWGFCQPVLTYYLFFGEDLFKGLRYMLEKTIPYHGFSLELLINILIGVIILKALVGVLLVLLAGRSPKAVEFQQRMMELGLRKKPGLRPDSSPAIQALKDLLRPMFLLSLALTAVFLAFTEHDAATMVWMLLRPIGVGFIFFYVSRTLTIDTYLAKMEQGRFRGFALSARKALEKVRSVL